MRLSYKLQTGRNEYGACPGHSTLSPRWPLRSLGLAPSRDRGENYRSGVWGVFHRRARGENAFVPSRADRDLRQHQALCCFSLMREKIIEFLVITVFLFSSHHEMQLWCGLRWVGYVQYVFGLNSYFCKYFATLLRVLSHYVIDSHVINWIVSPSRLMKM